MLKFLVGGRRWNRGIAGGKKNNQIFVNVSKISLVISVFLLQMCGSKLFKSGVPVEKILKSKVVTICLLIQRI